MIKNNYQVLGVMSGTSLDGIDIADVSFSISENNAWDFTINNSETIEYSGSWKKKLKNAITFSETELLQLNKEYTTCLSEIILEFINKYKLFNLDAVCSHGHTILHQPSNGITLQIGNLPILSEKIKQTVVCNFRVQDVGLGGQGAPLVPIGDQLLFNEYDYCLNLGGFANVSANKGGSPIAYDICPVNIVLNHFAEKLGMPYDDRGELARSGKFLLAKSAQLDALPFYKLPAPKSLGFEWVKKEVFPILQATYAIPQDSLKTFTNHASRQIARQFNKGAKVLVTGGGAYNSYLLEKIKFYKDIELIVPEPTLVEYKEALIFGLLGVLKLRNQVNCLASVTGAKRDHSSGEIFFP